MGLALTPEKWIVLDYLTNGCYLWTVNDEKDIWKKNCFFLSFWAYIFFCYPFHILVFKLKVMSSTWSRYMFNEDVEVKRFFSPPPPLSPEIEEWKDGGEKALRFEKMYAWFKYKNLVQFRTSSWNVLTNWGVRINCTEASVDLLSLAVGCVAGGKTSFFWN